MRSGTTRGEREREREREEKVGVFGWIEKLRRLHVEGGEEREKGLNFERSCCNGIGPQEWIGNSSSSSYKISSRRYFELAARAATVAQGQ
jgi:hypothetical protein